MLTAEVTWAAVFVEVARVVAWTEVVEVAALMLETTATGVLVLTTTGVVVAATEVILATYAVSGVKCYTIYKEENLPLHQ